jgi:hypothetical protein
MNIIRFRGDFSNASDPSGMALDNPLCWNPSVNPIPDPEMFDSVGADPRYGLNRPYCGDVYVEHLVQLKN